MQSPNEFRQPGNDPESRPDAVTESRTIRFFISSTFLDLQAARDRLIRDVFTRIAKRCEERGVTFSSIDLRWGITDEQVKRGELLPILFDRIDRCGSFFLGILGRRYGSVVETVPADLREHHPWLADLADRSITEIEFNYALLRPETSREHAFIYAQRDLATSAEDPRQVQLLARLDRYSPRPFDDLDDLASQIESDLTQLVDGLYPGGALDADTRESLEQELYRKKLCVGFAGRDEELEDLTGYAEKGGSPVVINGPLGVGKSALVAKLSQHVDPSVEVVIHHVGGSGASNSLMALLRRLVRELGAADEIRRDPPASVHEGKAQLANLLSERADDRPLLLVIDGPERLEDTDGAHSLHWLPREVASSVRLIVATGDDDMASGLGSRGWRRVDLTVLPEDVVGEIATAVVDVHGKQLPSTVQDELRRRPQVRQPRFLRVLLEELRLAGSPADLEQRLAECLAAEDLLQLYGAVLSRLEDDLGAGGRDSARAILVPLALSRRGLTEAELLTASQATPLAWARIHAGLGSAVLERSGYYAVGDDQLKAAIKERYFPDEAGDQAACRALAQMFIQGEDRDREAHELPALLTRAGDWQGLHDRLADTAFLGAVYSDDEFAPLRLWRQVEEHTGRSRLAAYQPVLAAPEQHGALASLTAQILRSGGHKEEAFKLYKALEKVLIADDDVYGLLECYLDQAAAAYEVGDWTLARQTLVGLVPMCREGGYDNILQKSLLNLSIIVHKQGDPDAALEILREQIAICRRLTKLDDLGMGLHNQALVFMERNQFKEALAALTEAEDLAQETASDPALALVLRTKAQLYLSAGLDDEAVAMLERQLEILSDYDENTPMCVCLLGLAQARFNAEMYDESEKLAKRALEIARRQGVPREQSIAMSRLASVASRRGRFHDAVSLSESALAAERNAQNVEDLPLTLAGHAKILAAAGAWDAAIDTYREAIAFARRSGAWPREQALLLQGIQLAVDIRGHGHGEQGSEEFLAECGPRLIEIYVEHVAEGDPDPEAIAKLEGLIRGDRDLAGQGVDETLATGDAGTDLRRLAEAHDQKALEQREAGRTDEAIEHFLKSAEVWRRCPQEQPERWNHAAKQQYRAVCGNLGDLLMSRGRAAEALKAYAAMETQARELGEWVWAWKPARNQAFILHKAGEVASAIDCVQRWQEAALNAGDIASTAESLQWLVQMLVSQGQRQQARAYIDGFERFANEHDIGQLLPFLSNLREQYLG